MKIAVLKETGDHEHRVAATPETVKKLIGMGAEVTIESGAGEGASLPDALFEQAGASIAADPSSTVAGADIILKVRGPENLESLAGAKPGALLIAILNPYGARAEIEALAKAGLTAFAMDFMPRITRAQSMDVLSSQSNLAGYKAVLEAAQEYGRVFPMMMTAAGTVAPARVFIMGVGVAGLQAIATARRLGAIVLATDVRPIAREQVESLGAKFVMVETEESEQAETSGGYAREMSDDYKKKQAELIAETIKKQDIVITTALIPGRPAPVLITDEMVKSMRPGSVIVDLAVEQGGNVTLSKPGQVTVVNGVKIVGHLNLPSRLAADASQFYAKNTLHFLALLIDEETKEIKIDWEDEIIQGTALTRDGAVIHPALGGD